jgi:hypothetical protein
MQPAFDFAYGAALLGFGRFNEVGRRRSGSSISPSFAMSLAFEPGEAAIRAARRRSISSSTSVSHPARNAARCIRPIGTSPALIAISS